MKCLIIGAFNPGQNEGVFQEACKKVGQFLAKKGYSLIVCSPFKDSADYWVLSEFISNADIDKQTVEMHFVDSEDSRKEIEKIESEFNSNIIKIPHSCFETKEGNSISYSWLLCQLEALDVCNYIITIGGKVDGSANMLLLLAESRKTPIVPLTFMGGAALKVFDRKRYELEDKLGSNFSNLNEGTKIFDSDGIEKIIADHKILKGSKNKGDINKLKFFISYSRERPEEADFIENLLRRRNLNVFRDDSDFGAGSSIPKMITEKIHSADVFIALWCSQYACSPWCIDEMDLALDRHEAGKLDLWIFCVDNTRMVPKRARTLLCYQTKKREEIEGKLLKLIERVN